VTYEVPQRTRVHLRVYDVKGRLVRTLAKGMVEPGVHTAVFDGQSDGGRDLASGTYFLTLDAGGQRASEKLNLVR
jgi:flagellar hook assembly protein FlgD